MVSCVQDPLEFFVIDRSHAQNVLKLVMMFVLLPFAWKSRNPGPCVSNRLYDHSLDGKAFSQEIQVRWVWSSLPWQHHSLLMILDLNP
jgi:hypothetical protein